MRKLILCTSLAILVLSSGRVCGQSDTEPPESPVLNLVNVNYLTGNVEISWSLSTSPDVSGYIVYLYRNNEGYAIDTLHNSLVTNYLRTRSGTSYSSESFVVAAIDTAGNFSPLSNELSTIYTGAKVDTCNKKIEITWNSYISYPKQVLGYTVFYSTDGENFTEAGHTSAEKNSLTITDFITDIQYCFFIRADLGGEVFSGSNKTCVETKMQRPPRWINADYATINNDNNIELSFTVDPSSEIRTLQLERKTGSSVTFEWIAQLPASSGPQKYIDTNADINRIYYYRASALNNCGNPISYSNPATNIVLLLARNENDIILTWNHYRKWMGVVDNYKLMVDTGNGWNEKLSVSTVDTTFTFRYSDIMYDISGDEVCFLIKAVEASNPYGITGESQSYRVCTPLTEIITVPNIFTPDNNLINDYFRPFLSFTPLDYHLIITDLKRKTLFETSDYAAEWDGTQNGKLLSQGVYLWFLKVRTPSGISISKSGTVTIVSNR